MNVKTIDLSSYTNLPVDEIQIAGKTLPEVWVTTPHKGKVQVLTKKTNHALFGAPTQTEKDSSVLIKQLQAIEEEAKTFLLEQWLKNNA